MDANSTSASYAASPTVESTTSSHITPSLPSSGSKSQTTPPPTLSWSQKHNSTLSTTPIICYANTTIDIFTYLNPILQKLPWDVYTSIWYEKWSTILAVETDLSRWNAAFDLATINVDASGSAHYSSILTKYNDAIYSLWDSGADPIFRDEAASDPCLFLTCRAQYNAQSSLFKSAHPNDIFWYSASAPCCGQCAIFWAAVSLKYCKCAFLRAIISPLSARFISVPPYLHSNKQIASLRLPRFQMMLIRRCLWTGPTPNPLPSITALIEPSGPDGKRTT